MVRTTNSTRVLILGSSGFIGSNLMYSFKELDYDVHGIRYKFKNPFNVWDNEHYSDLTNKTFVDDAILGIDNDIIIQAAATTSGANEIINKPYFHVTDNAVMNSLILRDVFDSQAVKHFIFFSCTVMYPQIDRPLKEEDFNGDINEKYFGVGWTKVYIEKMCEFYSKICPNTKFTIIRHSNVVGPMDKFNPEKSHVFAATIKKVADAIEGQSVKVWGTGEERRDFIHINDLISFVQGVIQLQENNFEIFNVGSGITYSVKELVDAIIKVSKKDLKVKFEKTNKTIRTSTALNIEKAKDAVGWQPTYDLIDCIEDTYEWYQNNKNLWDK